LRVTGNFAVHDMCSSKEQHSRHAHLKSKEEANHICAVRCGAVQCVGTATKRPSADRPI
jgi:hypothetical protein